MNTQTLPQASRPFSKPDPQYDQQLLAGALAALSTLATTWLRRNGASPSQGHWEAVERAILDLDGGEVRRGR